jgi:feruloyl esterase
MPTRTRPLCPYPQTAIYNGTGDQNVATSFHCGGNIETRENVCMDLVTKFQKETRNALADRDACKARGREDEDNRDDD